MRLLLLLWAPATYVTSLVVAAAVLVGCYSFRVFIFKAGVCDPIMSIALIHGASREFLSSGEQGLIFSVTFAA